MGEITIATTTPAMSITDAVERVRPMLTFNRLRIANVIRCETSFHKLNDWSPSDWATAMAGECGEACNLVKKLRRLSDGKQWAIPSDRASITDAIGDELADLVIYADLLAAALGINLGQKVATKFNVVSDRVGSDIKIDCQELPIPNHGDELRQ